MDHMLTAWEAEELYENVRLQLSERDEIFSAGQKHVEEIFNSVKLN